ncbi:MAG: MFS transporter [Lentisphaeria bacterium]|nr:MFS transporter [Lentisphaeria bacterium]
MTFETVKRAVASKKGFYAFLATLFLGAFNDNVSKLLVICFGTAMLGTSSAGASAYLSLAAACFILPYLLFSTVAGYLADRFRKKTVMVWTKVAEILIMLMGVALAMKGIVFGLILVLFCMGAQSAFFSPAKYGFLPETHEPAQLPAANGATQLWTFLAIIFGGWAGGALAGFCGTEKVAWGFVFCVAIAILGTLASFWITPTLRQTADLKFQVRDPIRPHWRTFREIAHDRVLLTAFMGNTLFWFLGTIAQLVLVLLAKETLNGSDALVGRLQAVLGLGIGVGCVVAGKMGHGKIPYRLTIPGGAAMGIALLLLGVAGRSQFCAMSLLFLTGFSGGLFQLPLTTAIQQRSPENARGRYLAAGNALDCISMLCGSILLWLLRTIHIGPRGILAVMGVILLAAILPLYKNLPQE